MDFHHYFNPVDFEKFEIAEWATNKLSLGTLLQKNAEKLKFEKADLVIIGIQEDRNASVPGSAKAPDEIRKHLYSLNRIGPRVKILDLGNLKIGHSVNDSYFALKDICDHIIENKKTIIILGGSQDLTFGITKAYEGKMYNLVTLDPKLDYRKGVKTINSENYLNLIFEKQKNLYSYTALGYQNYFVDATELDQFNNLYWDVKRLGQIRYDLSSTEPIFRDANVFSFDFNSIRYQDAPGQTFASPNGLYSEEACQLARYAGTSDAMNVVGFFNLIPDKDLSGNSSKLMAHIVWHYIDGFVNRNVEDPLDDSDNYNQFIVDMSDMDMTIGFFQSRLTARWWMQIDDFDHNGYGMYLVPCEEDDYVKASHGEIPDRWWKNMRKMHKRQNK